MTEDHPSLKGPKPPKAASGHGPFGGPELHPDHPNDPHGARGNPIAASRDDPWERVILHGDMDAFYASIEQLDEPKLRGCPVLVGNPGRRGVVCTASYEARRFGAHSAMPMEEARRLCPSAVVVPPRFARYQEISRVIMDVFRAFTPAVEPISLDEAFLDLTGSERLFGAPEAIGRALKADVFEKTGLTISVGISTTKFVAKVASDFAKPDGFTMVPASRVRDFLDPLPIRALYGVGPKSAWRLRALGLETIGDVANAERERLTAALGSLGEHVHALSRAEDPRPVVPERESKSLGHEETLEHDIRGPEATRSVLLSAADLVAARLRAERLLTRGVRVKLKTRTIRLMTRQTVLGDPTNSASPLYSAASALLSSFSWTEPLRLVGLTAFDLISEDAPRQYELFGDPVARRGRLDEVVDALRGRFGKDAIRRARDLERH